jgi:hypothetical protein
MPPWLTPVITALAYVAVHGPEWVAKWAEAIAHARDVLRRRNDP